MAERGYLLMAVDTPTVDYSKLSYACALSIKITQPNGYNNVTLVTNSADQIHQKYPIFDNVIKYNGPINMNCRSRAYDYSPYDETVFLDSDILLLNPVDHYWGFMKEKDIFFSSYAQTYKKERIHYGHYRKFFEEYQLLDIYTAWTYFKKSEKSKEFFELSKLITDNPNEFINDFFKSSHLTSMPTDETFALCSRILELEDEVVDPHWNLPRITHMKPMIQGWKDYAPNWSDRIKLSIAEDMRTYLGVWAQADILHYVEKDIITDETINFLESLI